MFDFLISPQELQTLLGEPSLVVVDVRHDLFDPDLGHEIYLMHHVPGAVFLHMDHDLAGDIQLKNGRHPLPSLEKFRAVLRRIGLGADSQVVIYDDMDGGMACRLWWMLQEIGHEATAILNGGFTMWHSGDFPCEEGENLPEHESDYEPKGDFVNCIELTPENYTQHQLVDSRSPERYAGLEEPLDPVAGRIPGALHRFWKDNLDAKGFFLPTESIYERCRHLRRPVFYCGSGVTSCHNIFCYRYAGLKDELLYVGSWSKWCNNYFDLVERDL